MATTAEVYDQGQWRVCLLLVDCRLPGRIIDERGQAISWMPSRTRSESLGNPKGILAILIKYVDNWCALLPLYGLFIPIVSLHYWKLLGQSFVLLFELPLVAQI